MVSHAERPSHKVTLVKRVVKNANKPPLLETPPPFNFSAFHKRKGLPNEQNVQQNVYCLFHQGSSEKTFWSRCNETKGGGGGILNNDIAAALTQTFGNPWGSSVFLTQPRPEPFGTVALSPALPHNNVFSAKWFIATVCTLQPASPPLHQHISLCCEVEGKWLQISFWQYLWEMTIDSHFITSLFLSWAPAL